MAKSKKLTSLTTPKKGAKSKIVKLALTDHNFYAHTSWHCGSDKKLRAKLRDLLSEFAFTEGGHFNQNKMCVTFQERQPDRLLTVYGSIDEESSDKDFVIHYQAVVEAHHPRRFYAGKVFITIEEALKDVNL